MSMHNVKELEWNKFGKQIILYRKENGRRLGKNPRPTNTNYKP